MKKNKKTKNVNLNDLNILLVYIQFALTFATLVLFILFVINKNFLSALKIVVGITLMWMALTNHKVYRKDMLTLVYLLCGLFVFIMGLLNIVGVI